VSRIAAYFDYAVRLVGAAILCLLPPQEREKWTRRFDAPLGAGAAIVAGAEFFGGAWLWCASFLRFATSVVEFETTTVAAGPVEPSDAVSILTLAGPLTFLAFLISPMGVLATYVVLTGVVRAVAQGAAHEIMGEPVVTWCFWLWRTARASLGRVANSHRLGPQRPDQIVAEGAGRLTVLSCREKRGWDRFATIGVGGRFYRVEGVEEQPAGEWRALAYRLTEYDPHGVIRGLIVYSGEGTGMRSAVGLSIAEGLAPGAAAGAPRSSTGRFEPSPQTATMSDGEQRDGESEREQSDRQPDPQVLDEADLDPVAAGRLDHDEIRDRR